jgi:hypothetical protein
MLLVVNGFVQSMRCFVQGETAVVRSELPFVKRVRKVGRDVLAIVAGAKAHVRAGGRGVQAWSRVHRADVPVVVRARVVVRPRPPLQYTAPAIVRSAPRLVAVVDAPVASEHPLVPTVSGFVSDAR